MTENSKQAPLFVMFALAHYASPNPKNLLARGVVSGVAAAAVKLQMQSRGLLCDHGGPTLKLHHYVERLLAAPLTVEAADPDPIDLPLPWTIAPRSKPRSTPQ